MLWLRVSTVSYAASVVAGGVCVCVCVCTGVHLRDIIGQKTYQLFSSEMKTVVIESNFFVRGFLSKWVIFHLEQNRVFFKHFSDSVLIKLKHKGKGLF